MDIIDKYMNGLRYRAMGHSQGKPYVCWRQALARMMTDVPETTWRSSCQPQQACSVPGFHNNKMNNRRQNFIKIRNTRENLKEQGSSSNSLWKFRSRVQAGVYASDPSSGRVLHPVADCHKTYPPFRFPHIRVCLEAISSRAIHLRNRGHQVTTTRGTHLIQRRKYK
jgi:hypothetical protein